ncbi:MAG: segregation and condensation protein A [Planctomycetota bacterium]
MGNYRVDIDIFAGPLDLLLYLVRKDEVDIYDISITKITDQYLRYIEMLKKLDIDLAGEFLVMAATLMHIKSAMLLPKADAEQLQDEDMCDPRAELIRQLLEYKKFKDAANLLSTSADEQKRRFARPPAIIDKLKPHAEPEIDLEELSVWSLLEAFDAILQATGGEAADISHIKDDTPIDLYQIEILHRLQTEGAMGLERIFASKGLRIMIGLFLALLELIREKLVWAEQPEPLGPIYLKALTEEPAVQVVQKAITASTAGDETMQPEQSARHEPSIPIDKVQAQPNRQPESEPAISDDAARQPSIPIDQLPRAGKHAHSETAVKKQEKE